MIIQFLNACNSFNDKLFEGIDSIISSLPLTDWLIDAILDSVHIIPLLFVVFVLIEAVEYFFSEKINRFIKHTEKASPIVGSILAIIPQCGFSIIASTLYLKRYMTKGTLIAIYLATSDEAIPILLTQPEKMYYIIPIISVKLVVAIFAGYLIDFILKDKKYVPIKENLDDTNEVGCCHHTMIEKHPSELVIHPIKHTLNIFMFILVITVCLNFFINVLLQYQIVHNILNSIKCFEPAITGVLGLIPNCAVSVSLTMLLISGSLIFSSVMAGLLSNAGLGILVLLKQHENYKDTLKIILILLTTSIIAGYVLQFLGV